MGTRTSPTRAKPRLLPMAALFCAAFLLTLMLHRSPVASMASAREPVPAVAAALPDTSPAVREAGTTAASQEENAQVPAPEWQELPADDDPDTQAEARALQALLDEEAQPAW